jgi:very-short-patch-repair endonuclease
VDEVERRFLPRRQNLRVDSLDQVLISKGGCATFAELVKATSRRQLAAAVEQGVVERLARGIYARPGRSVDWRTAVAYDGVVSHLTAADAWDLPLLVLPEKPHITVPTKRRPRTGPPAILHWAPIAPGDLPSRMTSLVRTVVDCARVLPFGEALAVADAALASGLTRRNQLIAAAEAMRGPGRPNARRVTAAAIGIADSFLESMLRALLLESGIDGFEPQLLVEHGSFRARVDLGHPRARLALEAEGYQFHGARSDFAADCRRYDELVAAGWQVLRFTYEQVLSDPVWVITTVRRALAGRSLTSS